ncbi:MAG: hypothetical protein FJ147_01495 [Deltaproteobacteria bacterium]|nr:hypothetical protein [Deltaproteobacteria bacterium]
MRALALLLLVLCSCLLPGCFGPLALHKAVLSYDETISQLDREIILTNIARVHLNRPTHFTGTSSIVAAFNYGATASFGGNIFETTFRKAFPASNTYTFGVGATVAELPTLSIVPIQGEEFTRRILTPMDVSKFTFLVFQRLPMDMVLHMMVDGIEVQDRSTGKPQRFILNSPADPQDYEEFRRIAAHLAGLYNPAEPNLFIETLSYNETFQRPAATPFSVMEMAAAAEKGYQQRHLGDKDEFTFAKTGRALLSNYQARALANEERKTLNALAEANAINYLLIDVRPNHPGGELPIFGAIKFRSFQAILHSIAAMMSQNPDNQVGKDPQTGGALQNPARTLAVNVTNSRPSDAALSITYEGKYYSIPNNPWDTLAFILLSGLYQMTVTDISNNDIPITVPAR